MSELKANPVKGAASDLQIAAKSITGLLNPQTGKINEKKAEVVKPEAKNEFEQEAPVQTAEKSKTTIEEFMSKAPSGNAFSTNGQLVH